VTGLGGRARIREALKQLDHNFGDGDRTIDIVGFSRGAALALHFANQIQKRKRGSEIRFLGLWDVVPSFGIPGNNINVLWKLTLPDNVKKCYHAMALDERRRLFPLQRVQAPKGSLATVGRLQEVWFRGAHSDIGGGKNVGLTSYALSWMLRRARENGLPINEAETRRHETQCVADTPIGKPVDPKLGPQRRVSPGDAVHESVRSRGNAGGIEHNDPPPGVVIIHG